ncbi:MAG: hypothetical protein IKK63_04100 [Clostridia bacterium]|nr:hypothetical protein [Clostridia bacterium]
MPMKLDFGKTELKINFSFAVAVTLTLIIDESGVGAIALLSCILHEAGHIICLFILGEKPEKIEFSFYGIKLERGPMSSRSTVEDLLVFASGPSANFIFSAVLFLLSNFFTSLRDAAIISLCIGSFNLLPCKPLDGGNIFGLILFRNTSQRAADKICLAAAVLTVIPMFAAGVYFLKKGGNITLLAVAFYVAISALAEMKQIL